MEISIFACSKSTWPSWVCWWNPPLPSQILAQFHKFFVLWNQSVLHLLDTQDQHLLSWINTTLSENVLAYVVGLSTSRVVWKILEWWFASLFRSHIIQLKTQIQTIKKRGQKIFEFLHCIKSIADKLSVVSSPIDDEDLILYTLNGLPQEYGPFKIVIRIRATPITFEELYVLLLCE